MEFEYNSKFEVELLEKTPFSIELGWKYDGEFDIIRIRQLESKDCWKRVYWGRGSSFVIENLSENFCFMFEIATLKQFDKEFHVLDSKTFKASTLSVVSVKSFHRAVEKSEVRVAAEILKNYPEYVNTSQNDFTALATAVNNADFGMAKMLLDNGAAVDKGIAKINKTPLQIAIFMQNIDMADLLIKYSANIKCTDIFGLSIAHIAIDSGSLKVVEYSLEKGIHVESRDCNGFTLLLRAIVVHPKIEMLKCLLDNKSNTLIKDFSNLSVLYHIRLKNNEDLVELLRNYKPKTRTNVKQKVSQTVQKIILTQKIKAELMDEDSDDDPYSKYL